MEHKLGEIITLPDGRKAQVVENDVNTNDADGRYNYLCCHCIFFNSCGCTDIAGDCSIGNRTDHKDIIYKEIR